jgi:hypothetical protein
MISISTAVHYNLEKAAFFIGSDGSTTRMKSKEIVMTETNTLQQGNRQS